MRSSVQFSILPSVYKALRMYSSKKTSEQFCTMCTKEDEMLERDIIKKIINYINKPRVGKAWHGFAWKNHGGLYSVKGLPDVMAIVRKGNQSFFLCFEVKQPGNTPTEIQKALIRKFESLGVVAKVVTTLDEVAKTIEDLG